MKGSKTWLVWAALAICAATILAAMTWQTKNAVQSEVERIAAEQRADLQEKMRLALWRMDTLGATLLGEETGPAGLVRASVLWNETGRMTASDGSPAPADLQRAITEEQTTFQALFRRLDAGADRWKSAPPRDPISTSKAQLRANEETQNELSTNELSKRAQAVDNVTQNRIGQEKKTAPSPKKSAAPARSSEKPKDSAPPEDAGKSKAEAEAIPAPTPADPFDTPLPTLGNPEPKPVWIGNELFLLKAIISPQRSISGSWIDLSALQNRLLTEVRDLLPAARLLPARSPSTDGLVLASFPLRLDPGPPAVYTGTLSAPIQLSLIAGWSAAAVAILAASLLVFGIMRLSERRASFVSAVTHELRTPLTTFRLYSEMLESGIVKPEKRGDYLRVLSREADRLSHLVENVLAFSRIERGSARSAIASTRIDALLEPMRERLEARLASAEMSLAITCENPAQPVRVDATAIEHILFNLIDNAAKYAASGSPPLVEIGTKLAGAFLEIHVSDHGPGIPPAEHRKIFRAFHKSAREAAETRPGVGLGLALSRRLARGLGGDLTCAAAPARGTVFILKFPPGRPD